MPPHKNWNDKCVISSKEISGCDLWEKIGNHSLLMSLVPLYKKEVRKRYWCLFYIPVHQRKPNSEWGKVYKPRKNVSSSSRSAISLIFDCLLVEQYEINAFCLKTSNLWYFVMGTRTDLLKYRDVGCHEL